MKRNNLNNRGFTLVELLVVIVILIAIVSLAIPSITSSMERSKEKINKGKKEILGSAAELYLSNKNRSTLNNYYNGSCCVTLATLKSDGYVSDDDLKDADGNKFTDTQICKDTTEDIYEVTSGKTECIP